MNVYFFCQSSCLQFACTLLEGKEREYTLSLCVSQLAYILKQNLPDFAYVLKQNLSNFAYILKQNLSSFAYILKQKSYKFAYILIFLYLCTVIIKVYMLCLREM